MFPGREGAGDAAVGRVEETKAPVVATAIREWLASDSTAQITVLPVLDSERHVIGLLHMTDLVRQGVV